VFVVYITSQQQQKQQILPRGVYRRSSLVFRERQRETERERERENSLRPDCCAFRVFVADIDVPSCRYVANEGWIGMVGPCGGACCYVYIYISLSLCSLSLCSLSVRSLFSLALSLPLPLPFARSSPLPLTFFPTLGHLHRTTSPLVTSEKELSSSSCECLG
jgi:hypothetical protein